MLPPLFIKLGGRFPIARHEHVAVLYRGDAFRFASFLAEGLAYGDVCFYVAPESFHRGMLGAIRGLDLNPAPFVASRQLCLDAGTSDWPALRWLEEGGWAAPAGLPMFRYFEFHALLNYQVKHYPSAAVCQYNLDLLDPSHLPAVLAVHRHLIVENTFVRDNPFYITPERYLSLNVEEREGDVASLFREVGFDVETLLENLGGYGNL
jgi:hypothetical protein